MRILIITQYFLPEMGQNARRVAVERFDRDKLAMQVLSVLEAVSN